MQHSFEKIVCCCQVLEAAAPIAAAWRASIVTTPVLIKRMIAEPARGGRTLSDERRLTKLPRGFEQHGSSHIAEYLRLTSYVTARDLSEKECLPKLVDTIVEFAAAAKPLPEFGWKLNYKPRRDLLEELQPLAASITTNL